MIKRRSGITQPVRTLDCLNSGCYNHIHLSNIFLTCSCNKIRINLKALDILDTYLDLVELPPTESGHYDKEFDTLVGESARIT